MNMETLSAIVVLLVVVVIGISGYISWKHPRKPLNPKVKKAAGMAAITSILKK